jgi:hypothetical protein
MSKSNTKARYHIAEPDRDAYLSAPSKPDGILAQELWWSIPGSKFRITKPRLPDKEPQKVDAALKKVEKQATVALGTIVTQSWLLQYANTQLIKFRDLLVASSTAEQFKEMNEAGNLEDLSNALVLAQDAALDTLDLEARQAFFVKSARHHLWLLPTRWDNDVRDVIESFPIGGEGVLCGPWLKETLKDFKLADEALEVTEHKVYRKSGGSFNKGLLRGNKALYPRMPPSLRSLSGTSSFLMGGGQAMGYPP